jgi:hypothetical protein
MDDFKVTLVALDVWIGFSEEPNIQSIQEARRLLDNLTDQLIMKGLYVPTSSE